MLAAGRLALFGDFGHELLLLAYDTLKEDPPGRIAALQALVGGFPADAETVLTRALHDDWPRVRRSARILMRKHRSLLDPHFRLGHYLPEQLRRNPDSWSGDLHLFFPEDRTVLLQAIARARFSPALPSLVTWLASTPNLYETTCGQVIRCIATFQNEAIPFVLDGIARATGKNKTVLVELLGEIRTPQGWDALESLSTPTARKVQKQLRMERKRRNESLRLSPSHSDSWSAYWRESRRAQLETPGRKERLSQVAYDSTLSFEVRQHALDELEALRRYTYPGKR